MHSSYQLKQKTQAIDSSKENKNKNKDYLKIAFAPQFTKINPYQKQLAEHLENLGVQSQGVDYRQIFLPTAFKQWNPDIIHLHWLHTFFNAASTIGSLRRSIKFIIGLIILKLRGTKIVWTTHNIKNHDNLYPLSDKICNFTVTRLADAIIAHSQTAKSQILKQFKIQNTDKVFVVPHGNYIEQYDNSVNQEEARKLLEIPKLSIVLLFFGLIRPYKGIPEMLDAFKQLHDKEVYLVIAGKAKDEDYKLVEFIQNEVKDNKNIKFVPQFIPEDEVQVYMNACDVVVFPYRQLLTSGAAILAMSFGRACIAPSIGSMNELLDDAGAFLYNLNTEDGLQQAMQSAIEKKTNLQEMGEHNLQLAKEWGWDSVAKMTLDIYGKCMNH